MNESDRLDFVWLSAAVLAGLCVLAMVGVAVAAELRTKIVWLPSLAGICLGWAAMAWGLKNRRRWSWWLAVLVFATVSAALLPACLWVWGDILLNGAGDRHGVGREYEWILSILLPVALAFGFSPLLTLIRARRLFSR
jgi:hypothetical protein